MRTDDKSMQFKAPSENFFHHVETDILNLVIRPGDFMECTCKLHCQDHSLSGKWVGHVPVAFGYNGELCFPVIVKFESLKTTV